MSSTPDAGPGNFIKERVLQELGEGRQRLHTRFPPEPNGFLHLGHAKAICLNFALAELLPGATCNLRFDDTNPDAESMEYVTAIRRDVAWLGFDWADREFYTSDYFEQLYAWAETLIEKGLAYVDDQSEDAIRDGRGDFHRPGDNSPFRDRTPEENLQLFRDMRAGKFADGERVLRAKIDMASKDVKLRDPLMYRIKRTTHHRTGDDWCIYPMYDWAHGQSDAIESITHSICTLEFQNHRGLYDWFLEALSIEAPPKQIEFAKLNITHTILSKRKLGRLVAEGHVDGWDDARMPTLAGMRRRGVPAVAIRQFCDRIGVSKKDTLVDVSLLEYEIRETLNATSPRVMAVLKPLKLTITNLPEDSAQTFEVDLLPGNEEAGKRTVTLTREVWVDHDDFMEVPAKKWWRLAPGNEVRLRGAAIVTVSDVEKNEAGDIVGLRCTYDESSPGGAASDGRRIRGTIHWLSCQHAVDAEVRLYDRLFSEEDAGALDNFLEGLNPNAMTVVSGAKVDCATASLKAGEAIQFERVGYFCADTTSTPESPVFNRTIALKDSWAKKVRGRQSKS